MYATLGTIQFEPITGFQDFSLKRESSYAKHSRIDNKPRLQNTGEELDEINLKIKFHFVFVTPEVAIQALENARQNAEVLPLTFGNGNFIGNFVIVSTEQVIVQTDNSGNYLVVDMDVLLREAVLDDVEGQQEIEARKAAFANSDNDPSRRIGVFGSLSDAQRANLLLAQSQAMAGQLNSDTNDAINNPSRRAQKLKKILKTISSIVSLMSKTQKLIFGNTGILTRSQALVNNIRGTIRAAEQIKSAVNIHSLSDLNFANQNFQNTMSRVSGSSSALAGIKATRRS